MPRRNLRSEESAALMKAAAIDRFGPPSVITLHELPVPKPGPREILIEMRGAGVGSWDESVATDRGNCRLAARSFH
ncbi:MAG TPA: hypothetical protein VH762_07765 [Gemmatimonadaceae bacterium]|jgi:NADPH:quinone reductase-like Zn-dependent oxidoreductase